MILTDAEYRTMLEPITAEFAPLKIVLFGSQVRRDARPDSDIELIIVARHQHLPSLTAGKIRARPRDDRGISVVLRSPPEVEAKKEHGDVIAAVAPREGRTLDEAAA